jgi:hypothetical protein
LRRRRPSLTSIWLSSASRAVLLVVLGELVPQLAEALHAGGRRAQPVELRDDHRHRHQHLRERALGLRQDTELDRAAHVHRRDDHRRQDERHVVVRVREEREVPVPPDDPDRVPQHLDEAAHEVVVLALLAAEERDRLGVVAHADEPVPEVGLLLVLREVEAHEPPADQHREQRTAARVAEERRDELRRDAPEDAQEGHRA